MTDFGSLEILKVILFKDLYKAKSLADYLIKNSLFDADYNIIIDCNYVFEAKYSIQ